jgi:hypothetical protein
MTCLCAQQDSGPAKPEKKLAVLKVTYTDFTQQEREMVNQTFYKDIAKGDRMSVITEQEARQALIPLGIDPAEITDEAGYIRAGQVLNVDYVLVGAMDKIGNFVDVTFRLFTMPRGTQKRYPGGKTLDILVKEEIPNIINLIYRDLGVQEEQDMGEMEVPLPEDATETEEIKPLQEKKKGPPWLLIGMGGAAIAVSAAFLLPSGGSAEKGGETVQSLPRPPTVP